MQGEKIRTLRKEKKISQESLAEKLGVSRQSISLWENEQTQPTIENIIALADVFGVTIDDMLRDKPVAEITDIIENEVLAEEKKTRKFKLTYLWIIAAVIIIAIVIFSFFKTGSSENSHDTRTNNQIKEEVSSKTHDELKSEFNEGKYDFYYKIDSGKYKGTVHHRSCYLLPDSVRAHKNAFPTVDLAFKKGYKKCAECHCIK